MKNDDFLKPRNFRLSAVDRYRLERIADITGLTFSNVIRDSLQFFCGEADDRLVRRQKLLAAEFSLPDPTPGE